MPVSIPVSVHTIIHLGAGRGVDLERYRETGAERIILVEPDPDSAAELRRRTAGDERCRVIERAVADADGWVTLHLYNLRQCSSLRTATGLRALFPGLRKVDDLEVEAIRPQELLRDTTEIADHAVWLIVDTPGEEWAILNGLAEEDLLSRCALVTLSCGTEVLYESAPALNEVRAALDVWGYETVAESTEEDPDRPAVTLRYNAHKQVGARLEEQVRSLTRSVQEAKQETTARDAEAKRNAAENEHLRQRLGELDTRLAQSVSERESAAKQAAERGAESERLAAETAEQKKQLEDLKARLSQSETEREAAAKQAAERGAESERLGAETAEQKKQLEDLKARLSQSESEREAASKQAAERGAECERLAAETAEQMKQIAELSAVAKTESALQQTMEQQVSRLTKLLEDQQSEIQFRHEELQKNLIWQVDQSAMQVKSYLGVSSFLDTGIVLPELEDWSVAPDLGLFLIRLIDEQDYDLVIEFGSGSSTIIIANALANKILGYPLRKMDREALTAINQIDEVKTLSGGSSFVDVFEQKSVRLNQSVHRRLASERIPFFLSFEHKTAIYDKTINRIRSGGLSSFVSLVLAPLREYRPIAGGEFLFYACDGVFGHIAADSEARIEKVLVLVDGPPGATCEYARYPALPIVLNSFATCDIDFLLDDARRSEEAKIADMWCSELDRRDLEFSRADIKLQRGASMISLRGRPRN